ncbi:hypothetical protein [Oleiphilus messinensis]|uniref:hypothetical protein n=1 Tax=Oleiphilus messinensis TaxID=141451 RepID=UPI000B3B8091|nr:hypothetical protein [Oleiphilus messinensis]
MSKGNCLVDVANTARYFIRNGDQINVEPAPEANMAAVSLHLTDTALGVLLLQRGVLLLKGAAVTNGREAMVFAGGAATGKSTLAFHFCRQGWELLGDRFCALEIRGNNVFVYPIQRRLMLWQDILDVYGEGHIRYEPVTPFMGKFFVEPGCSNQVEAFPLTKLIFLENDNRGRPECVGLKPMEALKWIVNTTYASQFIEEMVDIELFFNLRYVVALNVPTWLLVRPNKGCHPRALAKLIGQASLTN